MSVTTYYVANDGNDSNTGSASSPFKTINKAVSVAQAGTIIYIRPGVYPEKVTFSGKNGNPDAPIVLVGDTIDPAQYPKIDGGDPSYSSTTDNPVFRIVNSSWLVFERMKVINSSPSSFNIDKSHYITIRRNIIEFHKHGVLAINKSSHILIEYNEIYQNYPTNSTWSQLKGSKWEGGAYTSFGGAGMNIIRFNYIHDVFNGIYLSKGSRIGYYYDANVWIFRNRFERVIDDPYEPESYAFNNHFFYNTLIETHRMASIAPVYYGPIYIYANIQKTSYDITGEAASGRRDSALKIDMGTNYPVNNAYVFNNSIDLSSTGVNGYGVDFLNSTVNNLYHYNNAYKTEKQTYSAKLTLINSDFDNDIAQNSFGFTELSGLQQTDPGFINSLAEDFRLTINASSRGRARAITITLGFASSTIILSGADVGAYQYGSSDFTAIPPPVYVTPDGGEDPSFGTVNYSWPPDTRGGVNPPSGPIT